jgi:predicted metal-dependent enzyme (double-stranded beta helix superfamily)
MADLVDVIEPMLRVDWEDIAAVEQTGRDVLERIDADRSVLRRALEELRSRADLLSLCEHPDPDATAELGQRLDKIVLFADGRSGVRVRLHAFWPGHYDLPHNHRWSFASMILRGGFEHSLFGSERPDAETYPVPLKPVEVRQDTVGTSYALHHAQLHALISRPGSVSLVVRGPAAKQRSFLIEPATGRPVWHLGAADETPEQLARKRMTPQLLDELSAKFADWGLF